MFDIQLDTAAGLRLLAELIDDTQVEMTVHRSADPSIPVDAFGQAFGAHATALGEMLSQLHARLDERMESAVQVAQNARHEVRNVEETDSDSASKFGGRS